MVNSPNFERIRRFSLYLLAASIALPIPVLSLSKLLVIVIVLLGFFLYRDQPSVALRVHQKIVVLVLLCISFLFLSLLWSDAPLNEALASVAKRSRLLFIPVVLLLVRRRQEAVIALMTYAGAQTFVLLSSFLLMLGVPVAWAQKSNTAGFGIFESYLAQAVMLACFAGLAFSLRKLQPGGGRRIAWALALLATANVLIQPGRSGQMVWLAIAGLVFFLHVRKAWRLPAVLVMVAGVAFILLNLSSINPRFERTIRDLKEVQAEGYLAAAPDDRLRMWFTTVVLIRESPLYGFGAGSFRSQYDQVEAELAKPTRAKTGNPHSNPHNEFLLWGVEGGILGVALLAALLAQIWWTGRGDPGQGLALRCMVTGVVVASLFNCALYDAVIGDFFCLLIGFLLALQAYGTSSSPAGVVPAGQA